MTGRRFVANPILTCLVALLLVCATPGLGALAQDRYTPPAAATPTPTPASSETEPETGETNAASFNVETTIVPGGAISAPAVDEAPKPGSNVRARPDTRPVELAVVTAEPTPEPTEVPTGPIRLDEPVLRWLPEILLAAEESGTPAHIIAGVMRLESGGNPNVVSPVGARGLMQIMPSNLRAIGVPSSRWHDPETNIRAGGEFLASRAAIYGSWDQAVGAYFGFGCDVFGTCTEVYISVVLGWADYYRPAIEDPLATGLDVLPESWTPPAIKPFVEKSPLPVTTPPPIPFPTRTPPAIPTSVPSGTTTPTETPEGETTPIPTEVPTEIPTDTPTEAPTEIPTEEPTPPPTEIPTEIPTEEPVEQPGESGTPPA